MCLEWSQVTRLWKASILCWEELTNASRFSDKMPLGSGTLPCTNDQLPNQTAGKAPSVTGVQEYPYACWEG